MERLELLQSRHSVRNYDDTPLTEAERKIMESEITFINSHEAGMHFELVTEDNEPFKGFRRSYGFFQGVRNYIAAVIDDHYPDAYERAGYFGEQLVIKATEIGLGTCFVGGTYSKKDVNVHLRAGRKIIFLITLGHSSSKTSGVSRIVTKMVHLKKMKWTDFFKPTSELSRAMTLYPELDKGLRAMACAPSSMNKRPVRISLDDNERLIAEIPEETEEALIDLGISKFNYQYVIGGVWEWGNKREFYAD